MLIAFLYIFTHKTLMILIIIFIVLLLNFLPLTDHTNNFISALIIYAELKDICKLFMIIQRELFCLRN